MSSSRAGPVPSRMGVRSMITVTYLSPRRVCSRTCSSTPRTWTPSSRCGSSIRTRLPSARTVSLAVFQATPSPSGRRMRRSGAGARCLRAPTADHAASCPPLSSQAASCATQPAAGAPIATDRDHQRGRPPNPAARAPDAGSPCRAAIPRIRQRRHHLSSDPSGSTTRQAKTARSGSNRCPVTSRPSSSSRQNTVRSGQAKPAPGVASGTSRSSGWAV